MENFETSQYRENLAKEIKQEPDKAKRREMLGRAKNTKEYQEAKMAKGRTRVESAEGQHEVANWPIEKIMRRLVREGKHLDQDAVYKTLMDELPAEEIEQKIKEDYMHRIGEPMIDKVRQTLGSDYVRLLIEPSVGTRMDELIAFAEVEAQKGELPSPMDLRKKFKESLGRKTVYRAASLTEQELEDVKQNGFLANYYRTRSTNEILQNEDGYESIEYNLANLIGRVNVHAGGFATTKDSMLISTSDFPEMAQYAAFVQLKDDWQEREKAGQKLYLIPIEVDEFRNIRYGKFLPHHIEAEGTWHSDQKDIPYNDSGIESFVEFRILPENILTDKIEQVDTAQIPNFEFVPKGK